MVILGIPSVLASWATVRYCSPYLIFLIFKGQTSSSPLFPLSYLFARHCLETPATFASSPSSYTFPSYSIFIPSPFNLLPVHLYLNICNRFVQTHTLEIFVPLNVFTPFV